MKETERIAIREMAEAARTQNVRLRRWQEEAPTSGFGRVRVWLCGWFAGEDDGDPQYNLVGWRMTEQEMMELSAEIAVYFAELVNAKSVILHGPDGTELRLK